MKRAYLYTLLVIFTWALSLVGDKALLQAVRAGVSLTPVQVAGWAVLAGWLVLLLLLAVRGRLRLLAAFTPRGWLVLALMGLFGWAGYIVSLNYAFTHLPLPDAIIINYLHPVFVVVFQGAFFSALVRPLSRYEAVPDRSRRPGVGRLLLGFSLCLDGVITIATQAHLSALLALRLSPGALAALFAALAWGLYSNLGRFVPFRPGREPEPASDVHSFVAMTFGLVLLLGALAAEGALHLPLGYTTRLHLLGAASFSVPAWELIVGVGVVCYALGYTLWLVALDLGTKAGEAHKLPPLTYLTPVLSLVLGWVVLLQRPGPGFWPGAVLIALGNAVIVLPRAKAPRPAVPATESA